MSNITANMFESLKDSLLKKSTGSWNEDMLQLKVGNTYEVRIIPNLDSIEKTFFKYHYHGWPSAEDGRYFSVICPTTYGERCPICSERFAEEKRNPKSDFRRLNRHTYHLMNVFVIKDPTKEDNVGTVKKLRFSKQLFDIISSAISGDDAEEFGPRIFDMSKNGCTLRIKVDEQADFPNYTQSRFLSPSAVPIEVPSMEELQEKSFDLEGSIKGDIKTTPELLELIQVKYYGKDKEDSYEDENEEEDFIPGLEVKKESPKSKSPKPKKEEEESAEIDDQSIDDLIASLDI